MLTKLIIVLQKNIKDHTWNMAPSTAANEAWLIPLEKCSVRVDAQSSRRIDVSAAKDRLSGE